MGNGEAIYATRPWKIAAEGPHAAGGGAFAGGKATAALDARDVRFTQSKRGDIVYAIILGWPETKAVAVQSLGFASLVQTRVLRVDMLGCPDALVWNQTAEALTVALPAARPCDHACALRIRLR